MNRTLFVAVCIETVNTCNRRCWFCKFGQPRQREPHEQMPWTLIEKIVLNLKELDYRGRVSWFKTNEPLLDQRIFDIVALTKRHLPDCCCSLLTNGDLLTDKVFRRLAEAGLDRLGVSAYDEETLHKIETLECRSEHTRFTVIDRRPVTEPSFVETRGGNIRLSTEATPHNAPDQGGSDCRRPSTMLNIVPDGSVVLCCADYYRDVVMGHIACESLEAIWYGEKFARYRRHLAERGRTGLALCESCTWNGRGHSRDYP